MEDGTTVDVVYGINVGLCDDILVDEKVGVFVVIFEDTHDCDNIQSLFVEQYACGLQQLFELQPHALFA